MQLYANYPNPFNPETTIPFDLPAPMYVTLKVYNVIGQEVATLVSDTYPAGRHRIRWDAGRLPSGLYLYQLRAGGQTQARTFSLLK